VRCVILLVSVFALAACQDDSLRAAERAAVETAEPVDPPDDDDPDDPDEPDIIDPPVACMFYGVDGDGQLWVIDPIAVTASLVGPSGVSGITDIGITHDGVILAVTRRSFYRLSPSTGAATLIAADVYSDKVAGDALPDGSMLIGGNRSVGKINPTTSVVTVRGDLLPSGWNFSGDLAVIDSRTAYGSGTNLFSIDHLFFIDLVTGAATNMGSLERSWVFGLDFGCDGELYGLVDGDTPELVRINLSGMSFTVDELGPVSGPASLWGAAGPAD
jgi:hypothetical protein